jgi:hypothetical protein
MEQIKYNGHDISTILSIIYSIDRILEYKESLIEDETSDIVFIDAITYHLVNIGRTSKSLSEQFQKHHENIKWFLVNFLELEGRPTFSDDSIYDMLKEIDDSIIQELNQILSIQNTIDEYINSTEFLYHELTMKEFMKWLHKSGIWYLELWIEHVNMVTGILVNKSQFSYKSIIRSWKLHDSYMAKSQHDIINQKTNFDTDKFSILEYMRAVSYLALEQDDGIIDHFPIFYKPKKKTRMNKNIISDLPLSMDYAYPIKTKKSIWTVKNK